MQRAIRRFIPALIGASVLTAILHAQPNQNRSQESLTAAINEVKGGNFAYVDQVEKEAGGDRAIPILRDLFRETRDPTTQDYIASKLVSLGEKDDVYWDFVMGQARGVVESGAPSPFLFDEHGKAIQGKVSPEFVAWAKTHYTSADPLGPMYDFPVKLGLLAKTGDSRAIPLLRRGLLAPNYLIESSAAMGLVILKDKESVPLILEACKRAPAEAASAIAISLLEFHDPEVQHAAEPYLNKDLVDALHQQKK
jgi:hypothetical protein